LYLNRLKLIQMLDLTTKLNILEAYLVKPEENYADSFKGDIIMYFNDDFTVQNSQFYFLNGIDDEAGIVKWVDDLLSQFVMKFDDEFESEGDFIFGYL